jgi:hypothetical protein
LKSSPPNENGTRGSRFSSKHPARQAAFNHIEVSKALHIIGMFMPKLGLPIVDFALLVGFSTTGATSAARSHDPFSWERATEKNRNT